MKRSHLTLSLLVAAAGAAVVAPRLLAPEVKPCVLPRPEPTVEVRPDPIQTATPTPSLGIAELDEPNVPVVHTLPADPVIVDRHPCLGCGRG